MEDVYYLPTGAGEELCFLGADEADGQSFSGEFTIDIGCCEGLDELLEIVYGERIRKTIERLNDEWLNKMWKASDDDLMVFRFEQIAKRFDSAIETWYSILDRHEAIRRTRYIMRRHHNPNKVPPFKPDPEHWTRKVHSWKAKIVYETEDDAWAFLNQNPKLKTLGWHPYLCKVCSKWHIGRLHNK